MRIILHYKSYPTLFFSSAVARFLGLAVAMLGGLPLVGQTPSDAIMMPSKDICVLANYDFGSFHEYWEGRLLRENQTIATVHRMTVLPMAAIGVLHKLNIYVGVPYILTRSIEPNGGQFAGVQGLQDLNLAIKYEAIRKKTGGGEISALATLGFSTPISNYLSDYMPYSLGFGAPELAWRGIFQYKMKNNLYLRTSFAYLWRGYTEVERNYYYNNGSHYTTWMDVPSAWNLEGVVGAWLWNNTLRAELGYWGLKSFSGDDIRPYNAPQPTNKVMTDRLGLFLQYYPPAAKGFGFLVYHHRVLQGLNAAKMNNAGLGVTYQFAFLKDKK